VTSAASSAVNVGNASARGGVISVHGEDRELRPAREFECAHRGLLVEIGGAAQGVSVHKEGW
jgi:hypothetical protein